MNAFIEKNKKLLKFYCIALRLSGWLLLTIGLCSYAITIVMVGTLGMQSFEVASVNMPLQPLYLIPFGLLGLGIAQLIRYLADYDSKPGFILRHGSKFLYAYVIVILVVMIIRNLITIHLMSGDIKNAPLLYFSTTLTSIVLFAAKALILIGVAQFLKRLMPIIKESKTLV